MINLPIPLATPPWTGLGRKLESLCRKALYEYKLLEGIDKLAIAFSFKFLNECVGNINRKFRDGNIH